MVRILHTMNGKHGLPWHRVINAKGEMGLSESYYRELQMQGLEDEGVEASDGGRVDLEIYRREPDR